VAAVDPKTLYGRVVTRGKQTFGKA
jgi:hypothetical protein